MVFPDYYFSFLKNIEAFSQSFLLFLYKKIFVNLDLIPMEENTTTQQNC